MRHYHNSDKQTVTHAIDVIADARVRDGKRQLHARNTVESIERFAIFPMFQNSAAVYF